MGSRPAPTPDATRALHRIALRPSDPRGDGRTGGAARAATTLTSTLGTGLAARLGEPGPARLPAGLSPDAGAGVELDPIVAANPALAAYAAQLRAKREDRSDRPVAATRGLPLVARRDGTATGASTAPGGLARRSVPTDRVEDPDVVGLVRGRSAGAARTQAPLSGRSAR